MALQLNWTGARELRWQLGFCHGSIGSKGLPSPPTAEMDASPGLLLTDGLWAQVFCLVAKEVVDELRTLSYQYPAEVLSKEEYNQLHSVRLVCKRFNIVFKKHPVLSAGLFLGAPFSSKAFMSLLDWMQRESTLVEELITNCSVETTLCGGVVAANKPFQSLKRVMLHTLTDSAASMLSLCTNLTSCCFGGFDILDLEPLQALPKLSELTLHHGDRALGVGKLAKLTALQALDIDIQCDISAQFVHGLKRLSVSGGTIEGLADHGVVACTGLQQLSLDQCRIPALFLLDQYTIDIIHISRHEDPHPLSLTKHLSVLTQLTKLQIFGSTEAGFEYPSVFLLTNLVHLDLTFRVANEMTQYTLTDQLGVLHSLEHFAFSFSAPKGSTLVLEVSWHMMPLLQTVTISATRSEFDERMLGFAKLKSLKSLELNTGELADDLTAFFFGFMMYNIAARCPQVDVRQAQLSAQDVLDQFDRPDGLQGVPM